MDVGVALAVAVGVLDALTVTVGVAVEFVWFKSNWADAVHPITSRASARMPMLTIFWDSIKPTTPYFPIFFYAFIP